MNVIIPQVLTTNGRIQEHYIIIIPIHHYPTLPMPYSIECTVEASYRTMPALGQYEL